MQNSKSLGPLQPFGPQQQSGVSFCAWPVLGQESCLEFDWIHSIKNLPVIRFPYRKKKIHKDDIGKMHDFRKIRSTWIPSIVFYGLIILLWLFSLVKLTRSGFFINAMGKKVGKVVPQLTSHTCRSSGREPSLVRQDLGQITCFTLKIMSV